MRKISASENGQGSDGEEEFSLDVESVIKLVPKNVLKERIGEIISNICSDMQESQARVAKRRIDFDADQEPSLIREGPSEVHPLPKNAGIVTTHSQGLYLCTFKFIYKL